MITAPKHDSPSKDPVPESPLRRKQKTIGKLDLSQGITAVEQPKDAKAFDKEFEALLANFAQKKEELKKMQEMSTR